MGMKFNRVPVEQWVNLGNKVGNAIVQSQAADAGAAASQQQTSSEANYGSMDPNATYQGDGADGSMTNAEAASYGLNVPKEDASAGTGTKRSYSLGSSRETQDKPYTPQQQRMASLRAQADFYAARGDTDRAAAIENQMFNNDLQGRQRTQWSEEDRIRAGVKKSEDAFRAAIGAFNGPQLSQIEGTSAAQAHGVGAVQAQAKGGKTSYVNAESADPRLLAAMQAKTEVLLKEGLLPQYREAFLQTADMRAKVRAAAFASADKQYALTGDPTIYAKKIYPLIDDGHDFVSGKMEQGSDGKPVMNLVRKNTDTGQDEQIVMPVEQFLRTVEIARDPSAVLAAEAARAKTRFETNEKIRIEQEKAKQAAAEHDRKEQARHENAKELESIKHGYRAQEIGLRHTGAGDDGNPSREERLRYSSLFTDAGRRMGEAQRAISTLQRDPDFARAVRRNPSGPEALQLQSLQGDLKSYQDERTLYQGMLAGSQKAGPGLARQLPKTGPAPTSATSTAPSVPLQIKSKAERDALPKGAEYIAPDGQKYVKQ